MTNQLLNTVTPSFTLATDGTFRFEQRNDLCNGVRDLHNEAVLAKVWFDISLPSGSAGWSEEGLIGTII